MPKREKTRQEPGEELDSVNAMVTTKRNAAQSIRRRIEAQIERKAKAKRSREVPASANLKRST